jgi:D-3-phosphoglycerate dehydrogenase
MKKISISTTTFGEYDDTALSRCRGQGYEVILNPYRRKLDPQELVDIAKDSVGLIAGTEPISRKTLLKLTSLKVISRCGVGIDNIDIAAARDLGIKIFNTPDAPVTAVAELTIGLILNLLRKINAMDNAIRGGKWDKQTGRLLCGKKVGIIGFGRIGQKVSELLSAFDVELAYCDIEDKKNEITSIRKGLDEIIGWADILTLHISVSKEKGPMIGSRELNMIKKGSWLINLSRGGVIDEESLYNALKDGRLSGAALDVFDEEPYTGPLKALPNVILTPHIGSYARESRIKMENQAAENLLIGLREY